MLDESKLLCHLDNLFYFNVLDFMSGVERVEIDGAELTKAAEHRCKVLSEGP